MKHMARKGKIAVKKWSFRGKNRVIGRKESRVGKQTRKAKWCKMQALCLKMDKTKDMQG